MTRSCVICLAFAGFSLPVVAGAQDPTITQLAKQLKAISTQLGKLDVIEGDLKQLKNVKSQVQENSATIGQIRRDLENLTSEMRELGKRNQTTLKAISDQDGSGTPAPKIQATKKPDTTRKDVQDSLQKEGMVSVKNRTSIYQTIIVNGVEYGISAGKTLKLNVPTGNVTTQIPGRLTKSWSISAPNYEQSIDIIPATTTTVLRPTTPVLRPTTPVLRPTTPVLRPVMTLLRPWTWLLPRTTYYVSPSIYPQDYYYRPLPLFDRIYSSPQ